MLQESTRDKLIVCNVLDFQVCTAAMVLIVNLLAGTWPVHSSHVGGNNGDLGMARQTTSPFQRISAGRGRVVATQTSKVLQDLTEAYCGTLPSMGVYQVVITYFGWIRVSCDNGAAVSTVITASFVSEEFPADKVWSVTSMPNDELNGIGLLRNGVEFGTDFSTPFDSYMQAG
jgi:hypothetical protein